jgi:hypothetical protein
MRQRLLLLSALSPLLLPVAEPWAGEVTVTAATAQRSDIDFETRTHSLGVRAVTPYGMVTCDVGLESGTTRIDAFDDIFGNQSVLTTTENGYEANQLQCGYGLKLPLAGGELSGGIGMMRYRGETDERADGKAIELDVLRLSASYVHATSTTRLQLQESRYDFLYHHLSNSYDSLTTGRVRTAGLQGEWGPVYGEGEYVSGERGKHFVSAPLPLPDANFDHDQLTVSLGPALGGTSIAQGLLGPLRYIAPTYVQGSERGSFNRLTIDSGLRGVVVGMAFGELQLRLHHLDLKSRGKRDYSPVTDNLVEARQSSKLALELEAPHWSLKLENNRFTHDGYITVTETPIPYTLLTGCASASCVYDNVRREDEWKLGGRYRYSPRIALNGEFYQRERHDQQYEASPHHYRESGGTLALAITF